jgi:hypothetical protein
MQFTFHNVKICQLLTSPASAKATHGTDAWKSYFCYRQTTPSPPEPDLPHPSGLCYTLSYRHGVHFSHLLSCGLHKVIKILQEFMYQWMMRQYSTALGIETANSKTHKASTKNCKKNTKTTMKAKICKTTVGLYFEFILNKICWCGSNFQQF